MRQGDQTVALLVQGFSMTPVLPWRAPVGDCVYEKQHVMAKVKSLFEFKNLGCTS